ncbi:Hsp20/alpha crystallin family protein [Seonamhaeicola sediminis]|uniref:Hsp20/alpha crystallin family protein n=1 Tax=Seonamhaeicola sediminis TaxID=2528206 RepID=A0A562YFI0_9FLAO|nr:Hsp20/alpha crystallin family protein [Seonamhaeicola sediminis]TWO33409.1 Hsp20/alpha crystallin family protein [Seonamhaeicola sediminis]
MSNLVTTQKNGSLAKSDRYADFPSWSNWIDRMFNSDLPSIMMSNYNTGMTLPKVNIRETADAFYVDMAVPGMKKEDFTIDLDNEVLSISSEKNAENEHVEDNHIRQEFGYASFKRTFSLPEYIEESKIKATYKDGILSVHLPKKEEAKQKPPRTITIS